MTFQQAQAIWHASPTVKRGVDRVSLGTGTRLVRISDDCFVIRYRDTNVFRINSTGCVLLSDEFKLTPEIQNVIRKFGAQFTRST